MKRGIVGLVVTLAVLGGAAVAGRVLESGPTQLENPCTAHVCAVPDSIISDCSEDVTALLNAFIRAVPDGQVGTVAGPVFNTIVFPPGSCYRVEGKLVVPRRAYLRFDGQGAKIESRDVDNLGHQPAWEVAFSHHVFFEDFVVEGDNPKPSYYSGPPREHSPGWIFGGSHDVGVDRVEVHNVYGDGVIFAPKWDGKTPVNVYNGHVRNSLLDGCGRMGIAVTGGHDFDWSDNWIGNCPWIFDVELEWAKPPANFTIRNLFVRRNHTGLYRLVWFANAGQCGFDMGNFVVEDNVMEQSGPTSWSPISSVGPIGGGCRRGPWTIRGNTLRMPGGGAWYGITLTRGGARDALIDGNTLIFEAPKAPNYAVRLENSTRIVITNNSLIGAFRIVKNLGNSDWTQFGNSCGATPCSEE